MRVACLTLVSRRGREYFKSDYDGSWWIRHRWDLSRKWDKIDLNRVSEQDRGQRRLTQIIKLRKKGMAFNAIAKRLNITYSGAYMAIYRRKENL